MAILNINNRTITVSKASLLEALKRNRELHIAEYDAAVIEFKQRLEDDLKAALKVAKKGDLDTLSRLRVIASPPQSHQADFDEAIEMLEFSLVEQLEIDTTTFKAYVKNQWSWSHNFKATIDSYKIAGSMMH